MSKSVQLHVEGDHSDLISFLFNALRRVFRDETIMGMVEDHNRRNPIKKINVKIKCPT